MHKTARLAAGFKLGWAAPWLTYESIVGPGNLTELKVGLVWVWSDVEARARAMGRFK